MIAREQSRLPETGYIRLAAIVGKPATDTAPAIPALIPVCKSTWWTWVKTQKAPQPIRLSAGVTVWRCADVRAFAESLAERAA